MYPSRNTKAGTVQPDGRMWKEGGKIQTSRLIRCRLERTNARLQGKPINQSHSASNRALPETEQAIWNWSQQINTAAQLKASIMTIIKPTSLHQPHQESAKPMRSCWQPSGTSACKCSMMKKKGSTDINCIYCSFSWGGMSCSKIPQLFWLVPHKAPFSSAKTVTQDVTNVIS